MELCQTHPKLFWLSYILFDLKVTEEAPAQLFFCDNQTRRNEMLMTLQKAY